MPYPFMADRLALSGLAVTDVDASEAFHPYTKGRIGFKLPYWRPDGTPHPLMHRVRLEAPVGGKYTQPSKEEFKAAGLPETDATHPYLNPNILHGAKWEDIAKQQKTLLVVEGELKAACAGKHLLLPAIGIGGCANATFADPTTGVHQLHPVIASLLQPGDTLEIALDGDIFTNPNVNRSAGTLRRVLTRMGYDCRFVILPGARVNGPRQGVDDWIMAQPAANRRQAFDALERIDGSDGEFDEDSETLWDYLGLKLTAKGVPWGNHTNVKVLLSKHERYVNKFYYDEATCKIMHTLWDKPKELTDDFVVHEIAWIQKHINVHHWSPTPITASLYSLSVYRRLCRNTLHDDIEAEKWDGTPRVDTWLVECFGAPYTPHEVAVGKNWLIGAIARAYKPGVQMDNMLVLEGPQGVGKSKALEILAGRFYINLKGDITNKDFVLNAHRGWIADIDELGSFRKAEFDHIKGVITTRTDTIRAPYGHAAQERPRRFVFAGTTNSRHYLRDSTGNRRFWPVRCLAPTINLDWMTANRSQLLAEAKHRYDAGESWWEVPAVTMLEQAARMETDEWEGPIAGLLESRNGMHVIGAASSGTGHHFISTVEILYALGIATKDMNRINGMRVASIMERLHGDWEKYQYDSSRPLTLSCGPITTKVRGYRAPVSGPLPPANVTPITGSSKF